MRTTVLGRTGLTVTKNSFGALPVQRLPMDEAVALLRKAYDAGMTLYDTAHGYSDSEEKLGKAFLDVRGSIVITTKTPSTQAQGVREQALMSLERMKTDYIDVLQFHNPAQVPLEDSEGYQEMLKLRREGAIRFIGITCHKLDNALTAVQSGLYDTVQYPLSCLSSEAEFDMVRLAGEKNIGILCMKALCGGLLSSAAPSMAVLDQFAHAVPIYGVQKDSELEEIITLDANPPALDEAMLAYIEREMEQLSGEFCRACGYCLPCPAQIEIPMAARMMLLIGRSPWERLVTDEAAGRMERIENCVQCGACKSRCPYGLDTPSLLRKNLESFRAFRKEKGLA